MCTKRKKNLLVELYPEIAEEFDHVKNEGVELDSLTCGSRKKIWWRGRDCKHSWQVQCSARIQGCGCPICAGQQALAGFNDLASQYPELAEEWDYEKNGFGPDEVTPGSNKKVWWKGKDCGHSWQAQVANRTINGSGCLICKGKQALKGFNDLESQYPEIAAEWDYEKNELRPDEIAAKSSKKVWWKCSDERCNCSWQAKVFSRTGENSGCPACKDELPHR